MAKKKKTYKVSSKPKVAAMNEYIYKNIRESDYKVNRPGKPKKIYKQQVAKRTNLKVYKASPAELARSKYKGPKFSYIGKNKQLPNVTPKGIDAKTITKANKRAGVGIGEIIGTEGTSKKAFGIGREVKIKGKTRIMTGDVIGYNIKQASLKDPTPPKQKVNLSAGKQQQYKYGTSSPVKLNKKVISGTAKKAVLARGAKIALKGASRLVPGVGTAMLVKDVYDVTKWASKQPKSKKKDKIYGSQINKTYKYNR